MTRLMAGLILACLFLAVLSSLMGLLVSVALHLAAIVVLAIVWLLSRRGSGGDPPLE